MKNKKIRKAMQKKEKEKPVPLVEWYPDPPDDYFDEEEEDVS